MITISQDLDYILFYLFNIRKKLANNIVFLKFNVDERLENIEVDFDILEPFFDLYIKHFSKNPNEEMNLIENFRNFQLDSLHNEKSIEEYIYYIDSIITILNNLFSIIKSEQIKKFKTLEFYLISLDNQRIKDLVIGKLINYLESFIKIRGNYVGDEFKDNVMDLITYLKNSDFSYDLSEKDELFFDIQKRIQDYEYYLICKDKVFTIVPSSYIWFEFLLHCYYLYENEIDFNSLEELYHSRTRPSFVIAYNWYDKLYNTVICKSSEKKQIYDVIIGSIKEVENWIEEVFENLKKSYSNQNKFNINEEFFSKKLYFIFEKTTELQSKNLNLEDKKAKLKGAGIFENFYDIVKNVYSSDESLLTLYSFYESLNNTLNYLEEYEPDFLTSLDKKVIQNKEKFLFILDRIKDYFYSLDNDILIDLIEYFESKVEPLILGLKEEYSKIEKILEPEKVVCFNCGFENEPYNDNCVKCGKKLFKPHVESGVIKNVFSKLSKLSDIDEMKNYIVFLMNVMNNSLSMLDQIKKSIENINSSEVEEIKIRIDDILEYILIVREKISFIMNNDLTLEEINEILADLDSVVNELDNNLSMFYSYVKQISSFVEGNL